jgi:hypothetical protein
MDADETLHELIVEGHTLSAAHAETEQRSRAREGSDDLVEVEVVGGRPGRLYLG